jgi:cyclic beta-1,2-glucan synthetase
VSAIARRTSPTNIAMYLLSTVAAHDLGYLTTAALIERLDQTLTTLESLERHHGHFLNWYDTSTREPLRPHYVSTVDSGNLAGVLVAIAQALEELTRAPQTEAQRLDGVADTRHLIASLTPASDADERAFWTVALERALADVHTSPPDAAAASLIALAARATRLADGMDFSFLYDRRRRMFTIGYRLADAEGPGRPDTAFYDLLASESRLASFVAIAKGDVPQHHWFQLGRLVTSVHGRATLMSWGGTMFEYLMPSWSCAHSQARCWIRAAAPAFGVRWTTAANAGFRGDCRNPPMRSGIAPGRISTARLGSRAWLATRARGRSRCGAVRHSAGRPGQPTGRRRQPATAGTPGGLGRYGFYESLDYSDHAAMAVARTKRRHGATARDRQGLLQSSPGHGPGRADECREPGHLCLALSRRSARASHRAPPAGTCAAGSHPRGSAARRCRHSQAAAPPVGARRFVSAHTANEHKHFLSNGRYTVAITQTGGDSAPGAAWASRVGATTAPRTPARISSISAIRGPEPSGHPPICLVRARA